MGHLSRRDLLKQSAGATMVVRASPAWVMSPSHSPTPEGARRQAARPKGVVIAGGGLSGLCCGYELTIRGPEVVVAEATNRTGGHVKALHRPLSDGLYADAGAEHFAQHGFTLGNGSSMPFGSAGGRCDRECLRRGRQ
jgi:monoamine oxidase